MKEEMRKGIVSIETQFKHADVKIGGTIKLSVADARALYNMTTIPVFNKKASLEDLEVMNLNAENTRRFVRGIAKKILFSGGNATDIDDLLSIL